MSERRLRSVLGGTLAAAILASGGACAASGSGNGPGGGNTVAPSPSPGGAEVVAPGEQVTTAIDGYTLRFTVDAVTVVDACPGRGTPEQVPANEVFVVLDVRAALEGAGAAATDASTGEDLAVPLGAEVFRILAPDGATQVLTSTDASWACYDEAELAPPFVGPGEEAAGLVVLDSETEHGAVTYAPAGEPGWEWAF